MSQLTSGMARQPTTIMRLQPEEKTMATLEKRKIMGNDWKNRNHIMRFNGI
jgi:hypothetical protein